MKFRIIALCLTALMSTTAYAAYKVIDENGVDLMKADKVYTLVNLHPDEERGRMYSINYQQPGLIPLCTEVKFIKGSKKKVVLQLADSGREYQYLYQKHTPDPLNVHLLKWFGTSCDKEALTANLTEDEQKAVRRGTVNPGMTRDAVILAIGYPPEHVTPSLDSDRWTYWANRFNRFIVIFDENGVVEEVMN